MDGEVALAPETAPDSLVALRMAAAAAGGGTAIAPASLARLAAPAALLPEPWPARPGGCWSTCWRPADHSVAGGGIARIVVERMGFSPEDVEVVAALVGQHLLLPEVASRRDIDDPATIERVAAAVPSVEVLHLLAALTEADARATGPAAWKAELDLDIRSARVQTMGAEVVDAFYVRDRHGGRIDDPTTRAEIERAILHALPG